MPEQPQAHLKILRGGLAGNLRGTILPQAERAVELTFFPTDTNYFFSSTTSSTGREAERLAGV
jgi:hypothetical protein